jgi:hypothetical protein
LAATKHQPAQAREILALMDLQNTAFLPVSVCGDIRVT